MEGKPVKKAWLKVLILFAIIIFLKALETTPALVEQYYSSSFYHIISPVLRFFTGWIPFSVGDVLYCVLALWIIVKIAKVIKNRKGKYSWSGFLLFMASTFSAVFKIYIVFTLLWGLNYYRQGISHQLQLEPKPYTVDQLKELTNLLTQKINSSKADLQTGTVTVLNKQAIYNEAKEAYGLAEKEFPFLHYTNQSVKSSLFGSWCNYPGFLGYYNPFTGEAQVNSSVPLFSMPYTTCHEMAHQLGYASESEANFVGYLVATRSSDKQFIYSVYFDMFEYANTELYYMDSSAARNNYKQLDTLVKKDIIDYRNFFKKYENAMEPIVNIFYDKYLKANNQSEGIESYSQVIEWLIAYRNKYGKL